MSTHCGQWKHFKPYLEFGKLAFMPWFGSKSTFSDFGIKMVIFANAFTSSHSPNIIEIIQGV